MAIPPRPGLPAFAAGLQQVAWVVPDIHNGVAWLRETLGCPYVFVAERPHFDDLRLRGRPVEAIVHLALAYAGDVQLELIQPVAGDSLYQEFLEVTAGRGGLHHLGYEVADLDDVGRALVDAGNPEVWSGRAGGTRFTYLDSGSMGYTELFQLSAGTKALFARIKAGTAG